MLRTIIIASALLFAAAPVMAGDTPYFRATYIGSFHTNADVDDAFGTGIDELTPSVDTFEVEWGNGHNWSIVLGVENAEDGQTAFGTDVSLDAERFLLGVRYTEVAHFLGDDGYWYIGGGAHWTDYEVSGGGLSQSWDDSGAWIGAGVFKKIGPGMTLGFDAKWYDDESQLTGAGGDFDTAVYGVSVGIAF